MSTPTASAPVVPAATRMNVRRSTCFSSSARLAPRDGSRRECERTFRSDRDSRASRRRSARRSGDGVVRKQRGGRHDLARLTVAALRHVRLDPRALDGMRAVGREPFDRRDSTPSRRSRRASRTSARLAVEVNGARAALRDAAAELRAGRPRSSRNTQSSGMSGGDVDGLPAAIHIHVESHASLGDRSPTN